MLARFSPASAVAFFFFWRQLPASHLKTAGLRENVQFRVLRLLDANPSASQREMSAALGVSLGLVNSCLNDLVAKGSVKISSFRSVNNKLRYAYVLTPSGLSEKQQMTCSFLQKKLEEFEALQEEIEVLKREAPAGHI